MPKKIVIPEMNGWDSKREEFVSVKETAITLEHSLISLQKWESKWHKPYFSKQEKTTEEVIDYIRCMTLTPNVDPDIYNYIPSNIIGEIAEYINDPMTATTFGGQQVNGPQRTIGGDKITAEIIYYWMIALDIPVEYRKWHLNQLITLIRICEIKQSPGKKMGKNDIMAQNRALNAKRRAARHSRG